MVATEAMTATRCPSSGSSKSKTRKRKSGELSLGSGEGGGRGGQRGVRSKQWKHAQPAGCNNDDVYARGFKYNSGNPRGWWWK